MKNIKMLFPGKSFYLLGVNVLLLFFLSFFDLVGVAAILPVIQIAGGADFTQGYLGLIYNFLNKPDRNGMIIYSSLILVLAFIFKGIFSLGIKWWSSGFLAKQQVANSVVLLEAYANDSYANHRRRKTADILKVVQEANNQVYTSYLGGILFVFGEVLSIVLLMIMLIVLMPLQSVLVFIYFFLSTFLIQKTLNRRNKKVGVRSLEAAWKTSEEILDIVNGFRENKISGMTQRAVYRFQQSRIESVEAARLKSFYYDLPKYLLEIVFIVGIFLLLGITVSVSGVEGISYLLVFVAACVRILPSFVRLTAALGMISVGHASLLALSEAMDDMQKRESHLLDEEPSVGKFASINQDKLAVDIEVKDVSFKYPDAEKEALRGINFNIPASSSLALVGGSGSGKTTLIDILLGLYEPSRGQVTFNGNSVHSNLSNWHNIVGYVPQDVFLSGKTIREEIAYGLKKEEIDEARILECIEIAELKELIASLENGLDTIIGERGTRLSGGQRQRLGIARAIYRNPSVLVLDEATSALDNKTEHEITKTINSLSREITVIIVAHRLSTVRNVDQLLYMSNGEIITKGTFVEVRENNSEFAKLVELGQLPE